MGKNYGRPVVIEEIDPEAERQRKDRELEKFNSEQEMRRQALQDEEDERMLQATRAAEANSEAKVQAERMARARDEAVIKRKDRVGFSPQLAKEICRRIANGEMLVLICEDQTMPHMYKVLEWLDDNSGEALFRLDYIKACRKRNHVFEDELITIADHATNDYVDKLNNRTGDTFRVLDPEAIARSRLRIEMRLKVLKANDPKKWGDAPATAASVRRLEENRMPQVVVNFITPPKRERDGDDAVVIDGSTRTLTLQ